MRLTAREKLQVVKEVEEQGRSIAEVASGHGIARKTIYQWIERYRSEGEVKNHYRVGDNHYKSLSWDDEQAILNKVVENPRASIHQIARELPYSSHGLWSVLKKYGLNYQDARIAYADRYRPQVPAVSLATSWTDKLKLALGWFVPTLAPAPPPAGIPTSETSKVPRFKLASGFKPSFIKPFGSALVTSLVIALGGLWYFDLLASVNSWGVRIGYVFASLSLASGTLFFLYSAKYYLMLAAVLSFSQGEEETSQNSNLKTQNHNSNVKAAGQEDLSGVNGIQITTNHQPLITKFLSWLFGETPGKRLGEGAVGLQASLEQVEIEDEDYPKVTVALPLYNEKRVVERLLKACTSFEYPYSLAQDSGSAGAGGVQLSLSQAEKQKVPPNYQVLVLDDSTDETTGLIKSLLGISQENPKSEIRNPKQAQNSNDLNSKQISPPASQGLSSGGDSSPRQYINSQNEGGTLNDGQGTAPEVYHSSLNGVPVTLIHRHERSGFKGGALAEALKHTDGDSQFTVVFDADFIPFPDTLKLFVKYFKAAGSWSETSPAEVRRDGRGMKVDEEGRRLRVEETSPLSPSNLQAPSSPFHHLPSNLTHPEIVAVQGYQWHVLNKSENWITRGVRTEYAGSYVIERSGLEIFGGLKQIAGSVYAIKTAVLREIGWGKSLTEDFELTLKLYERGYKVLYTPYIQGPAECVSTLKRLIRQRMRWAEGHSHNIRKMLFKLLISSYPNSPNQIPSTKSQLDQLEIRSIRNSQHQPGEITPTLPSSSLTLAEKLELLFLSPYYLQAALFLAGTTCWLISETILKSPLPFWTSVWGWSLVLTNFFSLPLANSVGLFIEEAEDRDYLGIISFVTLSYLLVPFQAYASVKGFLEADEGTWFRTPKTGLITDPFSRGRFFRLLKGILSGLKSPTEVPIAGRIAKEATMNAYLALATANNQFNEFAIKPKRMKWMGKLVMSLMLVLTVTTYTATRGVPEVLADNRTDFYNRTTTSYPIGCPSGYTCQDFNQDAGTSAATTIYFNDSTDQFSWYSRSMPTGSGNASISAGNYTFEWHGGVTGNCGQGGASIKVNFSLNHVRASDGGDVQNICSLNNYNLCGETFPATITVCSGAAALGPWTTGNERKLRLDITFVSVNKVTDGYLIYDYDQTNDANSHLTTPSIVVPENVVYLIAAAPLIPLVAMWMKKRRWAREGIFKRRILYQ
jgi:cellulose synthase/poly-beta-1,6-N-acetylglucosamine synthase-like glycosyltransferase/transposase